MPHRFAALLGACLAAGASAAPLAVQVHDDAGRAIAGAVVFLDSPAARAAVTAAAGAEIVQQAKVFVPEVSVVPVGTSVQFPNLDSVRHHVYSLSPTKPFELKLYKGRDANPVRFDRPGVAVLGCNIHDQMIGWVVVVETPYHARSNTAGVARLADVPPGDYRLRVWHPDLPPGAPAHEQALTLAAGGTEARVRLAELTAVATR